MYQKFWNKKVIIRKIVNKKEEGCIKMVSETVGYPELGESSVLDLDKNGVVPDADASNVVIRENSSAPSFYLARAIRSRQQLISGGWEIQSMILRKLLRKVIKIFPFIPPDVIKHFLHLL